MTTPAVEICHDCRSGRPGRAGAAARRPVLRVLAERAGTVAALTAAVMPMLLVPVGAAIEISRWSTVRQRLQLTADLAALAGANAFAANPDAQTAAVVAAQVAELNGGVAGAARVWDGAAQTLADGTITVTVGAGLRTSSNVGFSVTVTQPVPMMMAGFLGGSGTTINATAWAELSFVQACLLALDPGGSGVTLQNNPSLTLTGCGVRSDAGIWTGGNGTITAPSLWARASIGGGGISGTLHPNSGTIQDPVAAATPAVARAFESLAAGAGTAVSVKPNSAQPLTPGTFSSWDIKGAVTLAPGLYTVNGAISLGPQASLSGSGVTVVTSGAMDVTGDAAIALAAARNDGSATGGAIPGIVFAGNSAAAANFGGSAGASVTGLVYYPNGPLSFNGGPQAGAAGCLEVIAAALTVQGNSSMAAKCEPYYSKSFGDYAALGLVQ